MNFGQALEHLKEGGKVQREGWNGKGMHVELQPPREGSKANLPYLVLCYPNDASTTPGARVPWVASQTDVLSEDWNLV